MTKGLSHVHQGTIVPRCQGYKPLKAMELVGPPGLEARGQGIMGTRALPTIVTKAEEA